MSTGDVEIARAIVAEFHKSAGKRLTLWSFTVIEEKAGRDGCYLSLTSYDVELPRGSTDISSTRAAAEVAHLSLWKASISSAATSRLRSIRPTSLMRATSRHGMGKRHAPFAPVIERAACTRSRRLSTLSLTRTCSTGCAATRSNKMPSSARSAAISFSATSYVSIPGGAPRPAGTRRPASAAAARIGMNVPTGDTPAFSPRFGFEASD